MFGRSDTVWNGGFCRKKSKFITHSHPLKHSMNMMEMGLNVYHILGLHESFATIKAVKAVKVAQDKERAFVS